MKKIIFFIILLFTILIYRDVLAKNITGVVDIDSPTYAYYYGNKLIVNGWVLSNSKDSKLEILFDNTKVENITRTKRKDVFKVMTNYNEEDTPSPGYSAIYDLSNIENGQHTITVRILNGNNIIESQTVKFNLKKEQYQSSIDSPSTNINGTKINIGGWVLSSIVDSKINIYVDEELVPITEQFKRSDVFKVIKGYVESNFNNKNGFNAIFDASFLEDGLHTVKLELTDNDKVIYTDKKNISLKKYKGEIVIDDPKENEKVLGVSNIGGWLLTDIENPIVELQIDNEKQDIEVKRNIRDDVLRVVKGYDSNINQLPGYNISYDFYNLSVGIHKLKILVRNPNNNEIITQTSKDIDVLAPKTKLEIDTIKNNQTKTGNTINISGWVMSEEKNIDLEFFFDNDRITNEISRFVREDVLNTVKDCGNVTKEPGVSVDFNVDNYMDGNHTFKFIVRSKNTNQILFEEERIIYLKKYSATGSIDLPQSSSIEGVYGTIGGWILTDCSDYTLKMFVKDIELTQIDRVKREDVLKVIKGFGSEESNKTPGYNAKYDFTTLKDGSHKVTLQIINNKTNEKLYEESKLLNILKYKTKSSIDSIIENKTYTGSVIEVNGWLMSTDSNISIETNIDGKISNTDLTRVKREDVLNSVFGYGGRETNPTPGFNSKIDLSRIKDGVHIINLIVRDNITDEVIYENSKKIKLKKYDGFIQIDAPSAAMYNNKVQQSVNVGGWALCQGMDSYLKLYIDDIEQDVVFSRYVRDDVYGNNYGQRENNKEAGYNVIANISILPIGSHTITLKLFNSTDDLVTTASKQIMIYHNLYPGIDVSQWQGIIDWESVANDGKAFAMVRAAYRGYGSEGNIVEDKYFKSNVETATNNGIRVGLYFFSQATNYEEGVEEAKFVLKLIEDNHFRERITFPIAIDSEKSDGYPQGRADRITRQARTDAVLGFLRTIENAGYKGQVYASKYWFYDNLEMLRLNNYDVWLAHYTSGIDSMSDYKGAYQIWQYSSTGSVSGIRGNVDLDIAYKLY